MSATEARIDEQVEAIEQGRAFIDRSGFHVVVVSGADASRWLNDLVTAGVADLPPLGSRRSLLLTPTGRIRADFHVLRPDEDGYLLVQDPRQPRPVGELLAPYVLSSDVRIFEPPAGFGLFCLPGRDRAPGGLSAYRPSMLGPGVDVTAAGSERDALRATLQRVSHEAKEDAVEVWRVTHGSARFPADLDEDSLPSEAGLETAIDFTKGCFLGQESVAKVRNLGHPPRVVLAFRCPAAVSVGDPVLADGREAGIVTSSVATGGGTALLARVRWEDRLAGVTAAGGHRLVAVAPDPASP